MGGRELQKRLMCSFDRSNSSDSDGDGDGGGDSGCEDKKNFVSKAGTCRSSKGTRSRLMLNWPHRR